MSLYKHQVCVKERRQWTTILTGNKADGISLSHTQTHAHTITLLTNHSSTHKQPWWSHAITTHSWSRVKQAEETWHETHSKLLPWHVKVTFSRTMNPKLLPSCYWYVSLYLLSIYQLRNKVYSDTNNTSYTKGLIKKCYTGMLEGIIHLQVVIALVMSEKWAHWVKDTLVSPLLQLWNIQKDVLPMQSMML